MFECKQVEDQHHSLSRFIHKTGRENEENSSERFQSYGQRLFKCLETKERVYMKKKFNSYGPFLGHQKRRQWQMKVIAKCATAKERECWSWR